jgi:hypothetical protein
LGFFPELPAPQAVDPEERNLENFKKVFGDFNRVLDVQWRAYVRSLKTDLETILEEE